ncbi:MAG: hypothetical protein ACI9UK_001994 [Candidatus Krumholzibacteriia bacterium]|jgi:hypothetical protein
MPISFLNPALLFGAVASALPVIIHFLSRRRVQQQPFSDLRFLDEVQSRQARSLGVRRWLLLLLRVLAILLIALAAAGPLWGGLGAGSGARSVLFVIDNSASMNTGQDGGTRLDEALQVCAEMIRSLPEGTSIQVVAAGSQTDKVFGDWLPAGSGALNGLQLIRPTDGGFALDSVWTVVGPLVARAPGSPVQVVILSDLQAAPVADEWVAAALRLKEIGEVNVLLHQIGTKTEGGAVLSVDLPQRTMRSGENITVSATVMPQFDEQVFVLEIDGRPVGEVVTAGRVGEWVPVEFSMTVPAVGRHLGYVRKETDSLPADDRRPFVMEVPPRLEVLIVHGSDQPQDGLPGRGGWRYISEALAPGGGPSVFAAQSLTSGELSTGDLALADVVFLINPDPLGRRALDGLKAWVEGGGQLVLMVGDPKLATYLRDTLLPALQLSTEIGYESVAAPGQRTKILSANHPVLDGLDEAALTTLGEVSWRRWFKMNENNGEVLLSLVGDDPLAFATAVEQGRLVVFGSDMQLSNGDFAASPMALPFWQRLTAWLAASQNTDAVNTVVGNEALLRPRAAHSSGLLSQAERILVSRSTDGTSGAAELTWHQGQPILRGGRIDRAGFVVFTAGEGQAISDTLGVVAAGIPDYESILELRSAESFAGILADGNLSLDRNLTGRDPAEFVTALEGHNMAGWLLTAALLMLLLELGVGRGARSAT